MDASEFTTAVDTWNAASQITIKDSSLAGAIQKGLSEAKRAVDKQGDIRKRVDAQAADAEAAFEAEDYAASRTKYELAIKTQSTIAIMGIRCRLGLACDRDDCGGCRWRGGP